MIAIQYYAIVFVLCPFSEFCLFEPGHCHLGICYCHQGNDGLYLAKLNLEQPQHTLKNDNTSYNINSTNTFIGNAAQFIKLKRDPETGFQWAVSRLIRFSISIYTLHSSLHMTILESLCTFCACLIYTIPVFLFDICCMNFDVFLQHTFQSLFHTIFAEQCAKTRGFPLIHYTRQ